MAALKPAPGIDAWSFSRLQDWRQCPFKAYQKHVLKVKEPGSKAMERGSALHKLAEDFTKPAAKKAACPVELAAFEADFRVLQKRKTMVEDQWTFRHDWSETGWFDKDAWCRIKVDLCFTTDGGRKLVVVDHKTGKLNDGHAEQLKLYSLGGLLKFPEVEAVDPRLWYLDHGLEKPEEEVLYTQSQVPELKKYWEAQVKPMLTDRRFAPRPNQFCGFCFFRKANGGPCKF